MLLGAFSKKRAAKPDQALVASFHHTAMQLARQPVFYTRFAVPDTTDGRYDLLCLTLSLFLFRIQKEDPELAQAVFDFSFKDTEQGLREAGVGDLGIPKHMKRMLQAFYGRAASYYEALEQGEAEGLAITLGRNLYNEQQTTPPQAYQMAAWVMIAWQFLSQVPFAELTAEPEIVMDLVPPESDNN